MFGSAEDVELAKNELNAAKYIEKKIADKNANTVLAIYRAALDKKMFRTPVGYSYMHDLQKRMIEAGIDASEIAPIPLYQIYGSPAQEDKPARVIKVKKKKLQNIWFIGIRLLSTIVILSTKKWSKFTPHSTMHWPMPVLEMFRITPFLFLLFH